MYLFKRNINFDFLQSTNSFRANRSIFLATFKHFRYAYNVYVWYNILHVYSFLYRITHGDDIHGMVAMTTSDCHHGNINMIETSTLSCQNIIITQYIDSNIWKLVGRYALFKIISLTTRLVEKTRTTGRTPVLQNEYARHPFFCWVQNQAIN